MSSALFGKTTCTEDAMRGVRSETMLACSSLLRGCPDTRPWPEYLQAEGGFHSGHGGSSRPISAGNLPGKVVGVLV